MVVVVEATVVQRKVSEPEEGDESNHLREGVAGMGSQSERVIRVHALEWFHPIY